MMRQEWPGLDALNAAVVDPTKESHNHDAARRYGRFLKHQSGVERQALTIESAFYDSVQAVLAPVQQQSMWRVTADRARRRCYPYEKGIWESRIDLARLAEESLGLSQVQLVAIDPVLLEYEREVTPHFVEVDSMLPHRMQRAMEVAADLMFTADDVRRDTMPIAVHPPTSAWTDVTSLLAKEVVGQIAIRDLNRQYLPRLLEALPKDAGETLRDIYRRTSWPDVWPLNPNIEYLHERVISVKVLDDDQLAALDGAWTAYRSKLESICARMEHEQSVWQEQMASTLTAANYGEYKERMRNLREQRWDCQDAILIRLKSLLPSTETRLLSLIQTERENVKRGREEGKSDRWPGP